MVALIPHGGLATAPLATETLWQRFREFVEYDRWTTGPDTHLAMVAETFNTGKPTDVQAWQSGCYVNPYNTPTAIAIWNSWATPKQVLQAPETFNDWIVENWKGLSLRTERRSVRTPKKFTRCFTEYAQWIERDLPALLKEPCDPEWRYEIIWDSLSRKVWGFGRYALLKLLECYQRTGWDLALPDIRPVGGDSPRLVLSWLYEQPELAKGNDSYKLACIAALVDDLRQRAESWDVPLSMFNTEVYLCEFGQSLKRNQYPGRALDSEMGHATKVADYWGNQPEFWATRLEMFPRWALGEVNNWEGRRKELGSCMPDHGYTWSDRIYDYDATTDLSQPVKKESQ